MLAPLDSLPSHPGDNAIMGVGGDQGPVVIAFPDPHYMGVDWS